MVLNFSYFLLNQAIVENIPMLTNTYQKLKNTCLSDIQFRSKKLFSVKNDHKLTGKGPSEVLTSQEEN